MSTPFLTDFAEAIVHDLLQRGSLEIEEGGEAAVIQHVASHLATVRRGSLISSLTTALVSCEQVVELWAGNDELKEAVDDLGI